MRQLLLIIMVAVLTTACASQEKRPPLDTEGIKQRADESHKSSGTY